MAQIDRAQFYAPITKIEKGDDNSRIVHCRIADETLDLDGQIADYDWLKSALPDWFEWGNVREMHEQKAVGRATELTDVPGERGYDGTFKVVDPGAVLKLDESIYRGVSWGAKSVPGNPVKVVKDKAAENGRIVGGKIVEVSLVDHPANESCKLVVAKSAGSSLKLLDKPELVKDAAPDAEKDEVAAATEAQPSPDDSKGVVADQAKNTVDVAGQDGGVDAATMQPAIEVEETDEGTGLEGTDQEQHAGPLMAALQAVRVLVLQEMAEDELDFEDVLWLARIGSDLQSWANWELWEAEFEKAAAPAFATVHYWAKAASAETEFAKRRVYYSNEHRATVEQALSNLTLALTGEMQGPRSADPSPGQGDDPETEGGTDVLSSSDLDADGEGNVTEPTGVTQAGPDTEQGSGAEVASTTVGGTPMVATGAAGRKAPPALEFTPATAPRMTPSAGGRGLTAGNRGIPAKGVAPDTTKFATADALKAVEADLMKGLSEIRDQVDELAKRAAPGGPFVGHARVTEKTFSANETVGDQTIPLETLQRMKALDEMTKSKVPALAQSARVALNQLTKSLAMTSPGD
ncbi:MAG: hypothetical protein ACYDAY_11490 [Candidatus Dormibacteria bacterium]